MNTLKSMRLHIGIFGKTNVGKSSILNRITNQQTSIVSELAGTTTDVVEKSMELLPIGPINLLDTAGIDDETLLAKERIEKSLNVLTRTDVAVLVCDYNGLNKFDKTLIEKFKELHIPYIIVVNKTDIEKPTNETIKELEQYCNYVIQTSATKDEELVYKFKEAMVKLLPEDFVNSPQIAGDLVDKKSTVIMVIPIDKEAPKGRIILPQVQTLRDLLDNNCITLCVKESELQQAIG